MTITPNTTIRELIDSKKFDPFSEFFWSFITEDHLNQTLGSYGFEKCGFAPCLDRLLELADDYKNGKKIFFPIYSRQEIYAEHDRQEAVMFHFPVKEKKPYAVIIPGGGFARQWGLIEGLCIAAKLNELGVPAFVLYYRTAQDGVITKALEDMYRGISYIEEHAEELNVVPSHYIVGGFSAGATMTSELMSENLGWKQANLPKPEMLILGYAAVAMDLFYEGFANNPAGHPAHEGSKAFLKRLVGEDITMERLNQFNPLLHTTKESCPPLYITANEDDPVVNFKNSLLIQELAKDLDIPAKCKFGKTGGHSYGLGNGLEVDGWLEEAVEFWKELRK